MHQSHSLRNGIIARIIALSSTQQKPYMNRTQIRPNETRNRRLTILGLHNRLSSPSGDE